eukprot:TRINITY_DN93909_c0_g1_i1.p1 TRINITY_DN93909_c0_g1~~TRINITY_DN93909_c0_g1_i1.p1  ORF type:complete len:320 (-),score=39.89 TRINITY_DN93909_c0_g1_i1:391-1350(-)
MASERPSYIVKQGPLSGFVPLKLASPLTDELIEAYLERLGIERRPEPDLQNLDLLVAAHVDRVPYENIDLKIGRPTFSLDPVDCAVRVAVHKRGGYCFILVNAFATLLYSLGYTVSLHTAACAADPPPEKMWGDHVVVVVHLHGDKYIADVGLGEGPRSAVPLQARAWQEDAFDFALEERPTENGWRFQNPANVTGCLPGFTVNTTTSMTGVRDFQDFHNYYWNDPTSNYIQGPLFLHRKTTGRGVLSLFSCTLRRTHPTIEGKYEIVATVTERDHWFALLREDFHMPLDDLSRDEKDILWQVVTDGHQKWQSLQPKTT